MKRLDTLPPEHLERLYRLSVVGFAALGLVAGLLVLTQFVRVQGALGRETRLLALERAHVGRLDQLRAQHERVIGDLAALEAPRPSREYLPTLVTQLGELAEECGLRAVGVLPDETRQTAVLTAGGPTPEPRWLVTALLAGRYPELLAFLERLQSAPKAIAIRGLEIEAVPPEGSGQILARLSLAAVELNFNEADRTAPEIDFAPPPSPFEPDREPAGERAPDEGLPFGPDPGPPLLDRPWEEAERQQRESERRARRPRDGRQAEGED